MTQLMQTFKNIIRRAVPRAYGLGQSALSGLRRRQVLRLLIAHNGAVVQGGPFAGMRYVNRTVCGPLPPKLLGSYEAELHDIIGDIVATDYEHIVDVGCAEGYYAVGLALRLPSAQVHAFDIDETARRLCTTMAASNGVAAQVHIEDRCTHERLNELTQARRALVVCDCEGCELDLLRPDRVPGLRTTDLLVELHPQVDPDITQTMSARFSATHAVTVIDSVERDANAYLALRELSPLTRREAVAEFRDGPMQWVFMQARNVEPRTQG
jgi:hypothetical protein